jgi:aldehyde:ferredoxin oxidoreductase
VGRRIVDTERLLNARLGVTRADDTLPARTFDEPMPLGIARGHHIERAKFDEMLTRYYLRRGWDAEGLVPDSRRAEIEALGADLGIPASFGPSLG